MRWAWKVLVVTVAVGIACGVVGLVVNAALWLVRA